MIEPQKGDLVIIHQVPRHMGMIVAQKSKEPGFNLVAPRKVVKVLRPGVYEVDGFPGISWPTANLRIFRTVNQQETGR